MSEELIPIQNLIYEIRGHRVMLDSDLAKLYEIEVRTLNQAIKRNIKKFPLDFMFQLTDEEWNFLISQNVISKNNRGGRRFAPYVFTEQGVAMLSTILNSEKAIEINIEIMRIFVQMRHYAIEQTTEDKKLEKMLLLYMENTDNKLSEHSEAISQIAEVLNNLIEKPPPKKRPIGFMTPEEYARREAEYEAEQKKV